MGTAHADEAVWQDAEARVRAEIRRLDDVVDDLRSGTAHLHWQGPGAGRFRWRTDRRVRELHDQRATLTLLLSLCARAGAAAQAQARADAQPKVGDGHQAGGGHQADPRTRTLGPAKPRHVGGARPC
jgi:hypothetical protein